MLLSLLSIFFLKGYNSRTHYTHHTHTPRASLHTQGTRLGSKLPVRGKRVIPLNAHAYVYLNSTSTHPGETGEKQSGKKV